MTDDILANLGAANAKYVKPKDPERAKRGKSARRRGNDYEREVAQKLGLTKVGMYGGPEDVGKGDEWMVVQVKNGAGFPKRIWRWLQQLPHDSRLRAVVIGDAPGPGHKRRELIVLDLDDFADWFAGRSPVVMRYVDTTPAKRPFGEVPWPQDVDPEPPKRPWTDDPDER